MPEPTTIRVLIITTTDGRELYTDHIPEVSPEGLQVASIRSAEISHAQYDEMKGRVGSFRFMKDKKRSSSTID